MLDSSDPGRTVMMRLFVAFEVPASVRQDLEAWCQGVRPRLPKARWVPEENLHLTLCFLGDTEPARLPLLVEHLETALADTVPLVIRVTAVGAFPSGRSARVVWAGVETDADLDGIYDAVGTAAEAALPDFEPDRRPFRPHITLARCAPPWPQAAVARLDAAGGDLPGLPFRINGATLFASELQPSGAVHTRVATLPMRGKP